MDITCISDLHGHFPKLEGGDLLIVAGDLTARHEDAEFEKFFEWMRLQKYRCRVFISGNHDTAAMSQFDWSDLVYLCDSGFYFEGFNIWGSPWTLRFKDMNPKCRAFCSKSEAVLEKKFKTIPCATDILITHGPPWGIFDECLKGNELKNVGSRSLRAKVMEIGPKLHVFGHIHEHGGKMKESAGTKFVNASHVDEWHRPMNKPVRVIL